jgi:ATP-dependent DNA helicase RecG
VVLGAVSGAEKLTLWWFFRAHGVLARAAVGREIIAVGRISPDRRGSGALMAHPEIFAVDADLPGLRPRYPRAGVSSERLRGFVTAALCASTIPDLVPKAIAEREQFEPLEPLLRELHAPKRLPGASKLAQAREQLAWAEAFCRVLTRRLRDQSSSARSAAPIEVATLAIEKLRQELGFAWTTEQARAIDAITTDLAQPRPMRRLLFGDVGSGKTAVILAALALVTTSHRQSAVFAPTTLLAEQYRSAAEPLARATGARIAVLTASMKASEKSALEGALSRGELDVLIGTHALLDAAIAFKDLALVVVDEQQRFGVAQRLAVVDKAAHSPHLLTSSATPIPRTLSLALRGELAISRIDELPPGRQRPETELVSRAAWNERVLRLVAETRERGEGTFVVCPRIGGEADDEGPGAVERHAELCARFGKHEVVLAHGRLAPRELSSALARFARGEASVLVGTTVVEVGIDVPRATLMVVDGAEGFGLSQLHQLRGRVARAERPARCLAVYDEPLSELARARLEALVELTSGAEIARRDLELRGAGDVTGTRQSGQTGLLYLDEFADAPWLERISDDVERVLAGDPRLEQHPGLALFALRVLAGERFLEHAG